MKVRFILSSVVLTLAFWVSPSIAQLNSQCASPASDPDGDGFGWENNQTCLVNPSSNVSGVPSVAALDSGCEDRGTFPWGWNPSTSSSCRLDASAVGAPSQAASSATPAAECIDTDGDGFGWNGVASCVVDNTSNQISAPVVTPQSGQAVPSNSSATELLPQAVNPGNGLPYPVRSGFDVKSLSTDFWPNRQDLISANTSGVAVNLLWSFAQPSQQTSCSGTQVRFDGQCFTVNASNDQLIKFWSDQGRPVSAILIGTPTWARDNSSCNAAAGREIFCAPRSANDFARFAAFIADRYNGLQGNGRIADFIIHNEVNSNDWYKVGCGRGIACDQERWISDYAQNFNAAYDRIVAIQPAAKVLVPLTHHFDTSFDNVTGSVPIISTQTFLRGLHARAGGRNWRVAYHPYHRSLDSAVASFDDLPYVTFGNIGVLAGWLRQEFPFQPESWEIHLTENGVSSNGQSNERSQDLAVCNSYRNVLGTPDIENYIYHRMQDHPLESNNGGAFGLRRQDGSAKPVWNTWSNMSGRNGQRNNLDCGFENLPYTRLSSVVDSAGNYRASTRVTDDRYNFVSDWYLLREFQQDTYMAYECQLGASSYISTDASCNGALSYGPVGYVHRSDASDRVGLYTCTNGSQIYSSDAVGCAGEQVREFIGYVRADR